MELEKEITDFKFTESQEIGVDKIRKFMKSNERVFILSGKAGTGKSTIIKYALIEKIEQDLNMISRSKFDELAVSRVLGVAMAHKAKNNLQKSIPYVQTFASAYGHKELITNDGERTFVPDKDKIKSAACKKPIDVFVIDECSMFSGKMLELVLRETSMYSKIIFMGDRGQLPPINTKGRDPDSDSPVFELNIPDSCKHELKERVRQTEGNPIVDLSDQIYEQIFSNHDLSCVRKAMRNPIIEDGKGFELCFISDVKEKFGESSKDYLDTKVIAYRNASVRANNRMLRDHIHNHPKRIIIPNEIIYLNKTYYGQKDGLKYAYYNSSEYIISDSWKGMIDGVEVYNVSLKDERQEFTMPIINGFEHSYNWNIFQQRVDELAAQKRWKEMYVFKDMFCNFSYGYSLTAYKAQGSTYKNVFVDVNDIISLPALSSKRILQTLYTAITRASHKVNFITHRK